MVINLQDKMKYGLMLSGGLDSAILLFLIVKQNPEVNLQCFTIPKHDGSALYVNNIIEKVNHKFDRKFLPTIYVGNPDLHHRMQSSVAIREIFLSHNIDYLFNALNQNPPELSKLENAPVRNKKSNHPKLILPFVDMLKDQILGIMYSNNFEELIDITHSCTEMKETRCNKCWQCQERAWAFKKLNRIDTGTF